MRQRRRKLSAGAVAVLLAACAQFASAETASASTCGPRSGGSTTFQAAWIQNTGGGCSYIAVRHRYDPVWSNYNYWTSWSGGFGAGPYYTQYNPEFLYYETQFSDA